LVIDLAPNIPTEVESLSAYSNGIGTIRNDDAVVSNVKINLNSAQTGCRGIYAPNTAYGPRRYQATSNLRVDNVYVSGYDNDSTSVGILGARSMTNTVCDTCYSGFALCNGLSCNKADSCTSGYDRCNTVTTCNADNCTNGFVNCNCITNNTAYNCTNPYVTSYSDAGTSNAAADTSAGGYNS